MSIDNLVKHSHKSGDLIKISYDRVRLSCEMIVWGIFIYSRPIKWSRDFLYYNLLTTAGIKSFIVGDADVIEIINDPL